MLDKDYWSQRYQNKSDAWDIGYEAPAIKKILNEIQDKNISILIPGCGNAYEAAYAYNIGFHNTYVIDWAAEPLENFKKNYPQFPKEQIIQSDFFAFEGQFDLIIEQTFFCAIQTTLREKYVEKVASLLKDNGQLRGLLFNCHFEKEGPPFGGSTQEYKKLFEKHFDILSMDTCVDSIVPRQGNEVLIQFAKKTN